MSSPLLVTSPSGQGWIGAWSPGLGDPSVFGWLVTVCYFVTVWLCVRAARTTDARTPVARGWRWLALAFGLLGLNKQLDLQTLPTEVLRLLAHRQGWYAQRRLLQLLFLLVLGACALWLFWRLWRLARGPLREMRLALVGALLLVFFIAMRAASFHHLDRLLQRDLSGLRVSPLLELSGVAIVAVAALRYRRRRGRTGQAQV